MASQFLAAPSASTAAAVVGALGAVQAQDYAGAKWAVAQRTKGATDADVERELTAARACKGQRVRELSAGGIPLDPGL